MVRLSGARFEMRISLLGSNNPMPKCTCKSNRRIFNLYLTSDLWSCGTVEAATSHTSLIMRIQNFTHKPLPSASNTSTQVRDQAPAEPVDSFHPSCSDNASLLNPALRVAAASTTQDKINRMQVLLDQEWNYFGRQAYDSDGRLIRRGHSEEEPEVFKRVGYYWKTGTNLGFLDGKDRDWPWSAAFISTIHEEAQVGPQFRRSPAHARYIRDAIFSKKAGIEDAAYWGHRVSERAPQVGDMVCYSRQKGVSYDEQPLRYQSHADIVTAVRPGEIDVVGGNVGHSVSKRTLKTDQNGLIIDQNQNWFAVLEPRDLSSFFRTPPPESEEETYPKRPIGPGDVG